MVVSDPDLEAGSKENPEETQSLTRKRHDSSKSTQSHGSYGSTRRRSSIIRRVSITASTDKPFEFGKVPSGKSLQSQTSIRTRLTSVSRSEYHEDLKEDIKSGLTCNLAFTSFIIVFGSSFLFGYNIGVLNNVKGFIKTFYKDTYEERTGKQISEGTLTILWSLTNALFIPGGMAGSFCGGWLADKIGRKKTVLVSHIFVFIGAALSTACVACKSPELLMIGRILFGINNGLGNCIAPMYLSEIAPFNLRGAFGTLHQLSVTIGIFLSSVFGLEDLLGTTERWPFLMLIEAGPALISLMILPCLPESPRFLLLSKGEREEAEAALQFYRGRENVLADMEEMDTEAHEKKGDELAKKFTLKEFFTARDLRMPIFIMAMLQVVQQFSGINAIFFYSSGIFSKAGISKEQIPYAVIGTNAVNVAMTIVSVPLIEKAGRRLLLLIPMIIMVLDLALITLALNLQKEASWMAYISMACVIIYVICFSVGLGPIPWMVGAELFRQEPRAIAMALGGVVNWIGTFIIAMAFESTQEAAGDYTFIIFMILMIFFTIFVYFLVPETKGKTIEEIAGKFAPAEDKIEVEEAIDDVFEEAIPEVDETDDTEHVTLNFGKKTEDGDVTEKVPLTKMENDIKS